MKKLISMILCCVMVLALAGCAGTTVVVGECTCPPESHNNAVPEGDLKTGLAIVPSLSKSAAATADANGKVDFDVTVVAVTVDGNGIIRNCVIDSVGATYEFTAAGTVEKVATVEVLSKNQKGDTYGMAKASPIGKEWYQQADALAQFAVDKPVEDVKAGIIGGYATDADLATSATIYLGGYVGAIEAAVTNAKVLGADAGQDLKLVITASANIADGKIPLDLDAAALTLDGEKITSCAIDSLQAPVEFDTNGTITSDLTAPKTKQQKGSEYGMGKISSIGKEWNEQADYFCDFISGKTLTEVATIAVDEGTKTTDVDLATGCTIAIGGFQKLIAKAAE